MKEFGKMLGNSLFILFFIQILDGSFYNGCNIVNVEGFYVMVKMIFGFNTNVISRILIQLMYFQPEIGGSVKHSSRSLC